MWIKVDLFVVKLFTFISSRGPAHTHTHPDPLNAFYGYFLHFHYNLFAFINNIDHERMAAILSLSDIHGSVYYRHNKEYTQ